MGGDIDCDFLFSAPPAAVPLVTPSPTGAPAAEATLAPGATPAPLAVGERAVDIGTLAPSVAPETLAPTIPPVRVYFVVVAWLLFLLWFLFWCCCCCWCCLGVVNVEVNVDIAFGLTALEETIMRGPPLGVRCESALSSSLIGVKPSSSAPASCFWSPLVVADSDGALRDRRRGRHNRQLDSLRGRCLSVGHSKRHWGKWETEQPSIHVSSP